MAEINGGRIAARQLRAAGIDTVFGVVAGPMIEVFAGAQEEVPGLTPEVLFDQKKDKKRQNICGHG